MPKRRRKNPGKKVAAKRANTTAPAQPAEPKKNDVDGTAAATTAVSLHVPIDSQCQLSNKYHVVYREGNKNVYNATLNQSNVAANNNKFYVMQILESSSPSKNQYSVWFRWGRIGRTNGSSLLAAGDDLEKAKREFEKKFCAKSGNAWANKDAFVKKKGKYDLIAIDYEPITNEKAAAASSSSKTGSGAVTAVDVKYTPLGKLTKGQVISGYESLERISEIINARGSRRINRRVALTAAASEFYTRIPHDFGMRRQPLIETPQQLKEKRQLLDSLN